jgi:hypothetical protein
MAVGVQVDYRGVTLKQYDEVVEIMGLLPGGPPPSGVLFHCVTKTDDGIRIIDVWESREALWEFQQQTTEPLFRKIGVPDPPQTKFFEVHNYFVTRRRGR